MKSRPYSNNTGLLRYVRGSLYCYWSVALLIAVLYSLLCFFIPYYLDDWTFMGNWRDDAANEGFSLEGWWRYYHFIREYDNGRIANALSPLSTIISPWKDLFPWISGVLVACSAVMIQRLSTGRQSIFYLSITWLLMIIGLPWSDTIFVRDYALNYIWAAAVTLLFICTLKALCSGRKVFIAAIILAILAGGWHEGFALPSLCGLGVLVLVRKFRFPSKFYIVILVYILAAFAFLLSPGLIARAGKAVLQDNHSLLLKRPIVIITISFLLFSALVLKKYLSKDGKNLRRIFNSNLFIVGSGIMISGFLLGFFSTNTLRSYFWPDTAAIALSIYFIKKLVNTGKSVSYRHNRRISAAVSAVIILACTAQTTAALVWQTKYARETDEIMALLDKSESGTVFYDRKLPPKAPKYTLGIPVDNAWDNQFHYRALWSFYITPVISVVPTALRTSTRAETEPDTISLRIPDYIDGYMVYPYVSECGDTLLYRKKL